MHVISESMRGIYTDGMGLSPVLPTKYAHQASQLINGITKKIVIVMGLDVLDAEVVDEVDQHFGLRAGPGEHRLLVITDDEQVAVLPGQTAHDVILLRIQIWNSSTRT